MYLKNFNMKHLFYLIFRNVITTKEDEDGTEDTKVSKVVIAEEEDKDTFSIEIFEWFDD